MHFTHEQKRYQIKKMWQPWMISFFSNIHESRKPSALIVFLWKIKLNSSWQTKETRWRKLCTASYCLLDRVSLLQKISWQQLTVVYYSFWKFLWVLYCMILKQYNVPQKTWMFLIFLSFFCSFFAAGLPLTAALRQNFPTAALLPTQFG